jgi:hypothetical protein
MVGRSCVELPREPLGVAGGADRAVEVEGFPQRPIGRRRVADRGSQAAAQLQDSRRQRATLDRRDQVLGAFESGLDLGAEGDAIRRQRGRVAVQDSGPGPDPKNLERLFDAFYTTKAHGLGQGLAISRRIIEAHGGRLWATANAPRGAIFQFTLPVDEARVPWKTTASA